MNIYLNNVKENWIIDRVRRDWYKHKKNISTHFISRSEIIWILSPWVWNKIPKKFLKEKKFFALIIILILILLIKKILLN